MSTSIEELSRLHSNLEREVEADRLATHARLRDIELWKAEMRGSIRTLIWVVGIGLGMPSTILGIIALLAYGGGQ
jgi:hypothetical protein